MMSTPSPWQYFAVEELRCKCGCGQYDMNHIFMPKLVAMRRELGFPFILTSAYRCDQYNSQVSSSGRHGPHTKGQAVDIKVYGRRALDVIESAIRHGMTGFGISQSGSHRDRFIHVDDVEDVNIRPTVWSY